MVEHNPEFDFNGYSKYVINAAELLNKELADLLYSVMDPRIRVGAGE